MNTVTISIDSIFIALKDIAMIEVEESVGEDRSLIRIYVRSISTNVTATLTAEEVKRVIETWQNYLIRTS